MRILLTGSAGYIGSALAQFLIKKNLDVALIDNYFIPSNLKSIEGIEIKNIDIREIKDLSGYDVLFHLAAISGIQKCEEYREEAFDTNVKGTFNLLKTFKGRAVFASTSAVYGQASEPELTEETLLEPRSHYGFTKLRAEQLVQLHSNYCILRFSNIYGKGIFCKRVVTDLFIENALEGKPLLIYGDGRQRRDFVHIKDVLRAYWYAMNSSVNSIFNIGGNEALNIDDLAELVCKNYRETFRKEPEIKRVSIEGGNIWRDFTYSSKKARELLGFRPNYCIEDEIRNRLNAYAKVKRD